MRLRLNWLFLIIIYLSVNGQLFATAIHMCTEMALASTALSSSTTTVNIHEHDQEIELHEGTEQINKAHDTYKSTAMDDCKCVGCDCVRNIIGQTKPSLLPDTSLPNLSPIISIIFIKLNRVFISLPHSNPYRPPIVA